MDNMHLVTGFLGREHIMAVDQAAFNAALIGTGQFVLDKGKVFEAQVISNNQVRVLDGELMMQGRFIRLNPDTYVDLTIENGTQGMLRNDMIVARYTKDTATGVEGVNLVVIKGTAAASDPVDPAHTEADITNGASVLHDFPLWRIPLDGLNVGEPVSLFGEPFMDSMLTLPEIRKQVLNIHAEVDEKIKGIDAYPKEETLTDATKTLYGLGTDAVPDDVFGFLKTMVDGGVKIATGSYVGTGTYGSSNPTSLTFDFVPMLVLVAKKAAGSFTEYDATMGTPSVTSDGLWRDSFVWMYGAGGAGVSNSSETSGLKRACIFSLNGKTLSYWSDSRAGTQANTSGVTYNYVAIGI